MTFFFQEKTVNVYTSPKSTDREKTMLWIRKVREVQENLGTHRSKDEFTKKKCSDDLSGTWDSLLWFAFPPPRPYFAYS